MFIADPSLKNKNIAINLKIDYSDYEFMSDVIAIKNTKGNKEQPDFIAFITTRFERFFEWINWKEDCH